MGRPLARDKAGQLWTVDIDSNQWRKLSPDEYGELKPKRLLDEMHPEAGNARFLIKNFASNPETALNALRARGFEAVQYGDGLNFAIRRPGEQDWRLLDPSKGGITEVWRDLTDLFGDIGVGVATGLGTASGGGVASIATGAASGAAAEYLRERAGEAFGLQNNVSSGQVLGSALGGGLAPPIGKAVGAGVRKVAQTGAALLKPGGALARAGEQFAQRIAGVEPGQNLEVADVLAERAATMPRRLLTPSDVTDIARRHMDEIAGPQLARLTAIRDAKIPPNTTVNVLSSANELIDIAGDVLNPRRLDPEVQAIQGRIRQALQVPSRSTVASILGPEASEETVDKAFKAAMNDWKDGLTKMPVKDALYIKRAMQSHIADAKGFAVAMAEHGGAATPANSAFIKDLVQFEGKFNESLKRQLPEQVNNIDKRLSELIMARGKLRSILGENVPGAESRVGNLFGKYKQEMQNAFAEYDRAFPGNSFKRLVQDVISEGKNLPKSLFSAAREANVGMRFTPKIGEAAEFGKPQIFPLLGTTGAPRAGTMVSGAAGGILGAGLGGPAGAVAGTMAGLIAASPAFIVRAASGTTKAAVAVRGALLRAATTQSPDALRELVKLASVSGAQATGRMIVGQDKKRKPKRVAYFTGG